MGYQTVSSGWDEVVDQMKVHVGSFCFHMDAGNPYLAFFGSINEEFRASELQTLAEMFNTSFAYDKTVDMEVVCDLSQHILIS